MKKKITDFIYTRLPARRGAEIDPLLKQALDQHNIDIKEFSRTFNKDTARLKEGSSLSVTIAVYDDRSYELHIKKIPAAKFSYCFFAESSHSFPDLDQKLKDLNIDIAEFYKIFRKPMKSKGRDARVIVNVTLYEDSSFDVEIKDAPTVPGVWGAK